MSEVWLIRHGESQSNAGELTRSPEGSALTSIGRAQARAVAAAIPRTPDLVVHTPYRRTGLTALPLLERLQATRGFVVVFCHGHVMRAILMHLLLGGLGRDREAMVAYDHMRLAITIPNAGLLELFFDGDRTRIAPLRSLG